MWRDRYTEEEASDQQRKIEDQRPLKNFPLPFKGGLFAVARAPPLRWRLCLQLSARKISTGLQPKWGRGKSSPLPNLEPRDFPNLQQITDEECGSKFCLSCRLETPTLRLLVRGLCSHSIFEQVDLQWSLIVATFLALQKYEDCKDLQQFLQKNHHWLSLFQFYTYTLGEHGPMLVRSFFIFEVVIKSL